MPLSHREASFFLFTFPITNKSEVLLGQKKSIHVGFIGRKKRVGWQTLVIFYFFFKLFIFNFAKHSFRVEKTQSMSEGIVISI